MQRPPQHGFVGHLLGFTFLLLPGVFALFVAVFRDVLPETWLRYPVAWPDPLVRVGVGLLGIAFLVVWRSYQAFGRLGWAGYFAWSGYGLIALIFALVQGRLDLDYLFTAAGFPYLLLRWRDFLIRNEARDT